MDDDALRALALATASGTVTVSSDVVITLLDRIALAERTLQEIIEDKIARGNANGIDLT